MFREIERKFLVNGDFKSQAFNADSNHTRISVFRTGTLRKGTA